MMNIPSALVAPAPGLPQPANPDHHLWCNHGTWFVAFTRYPDPLTKERVRRSLGTRCRATARAERDRLFAALARSGVALAHLALVPGLKGGAR